MPTSLPPTKSLAKLLDQSKEVGVLVDECVEDLSAVNITLKGNEGTAQDSKLVAGEVIAHTEAVESKVQEASEKLSAVNEALAVEVIARHALEERLDNITQENESAQHAAFHDALTGLPNRALFDNRLEHGLAQAKRHGFTLAVMFVDLDGFKAINDRHGHTVGDAVLQSVAERLQENTREDDTISRYGGDEFLYLLTSIDNDKHVLQVAEKIAAAVQRPCRLTVGELIVKPSIGISIFPKDGVTAAELIAKADQAMYEAKRTKVDYVFA